MKRLEKNNLLKENLHLLFIFLTLFFSNNIFSQNYCIPENIAGKTNTENIVNFSLVGENKTSINNSSSPDSSNAYEDYSLSTSVDLINGKTYQASVTINNQYSYYQFVRSWIDFNQDGEFSNEEEILPQSRMGSLKTRNFSFKIPNVTPDKYRLRIRMARFPGDSLSPCENYPISETEDYSVTIANPLSVKNNIYSGIISLYPNPASSILNIQILNSDLIEEINIYDLLGNLILNKNEITKQNFQINLQNFVKGVYFVKVQIKNTIITKEFRVI